MTKSKYLLAGVLALVPLGAQAQTGDKVRFPISLRCLSPEAYCRFPTSLGCLSKDGYLAYFKALKEATEQGIRYALSISASAKDWGCLRPQDISLLPLGHVEEEDGPMVLLKFGLKEYWFEKKGTTTDATEIRKYLQTWLPVEKQRQLKDLMDALIPGDKR